MTETYGLSFYTQYLAHWPEYFQVAESPSGEIMGYSTYEYPAFISTLLVYFLVFMFTNKLFNVVFSKVALNLNHETKFEGCIKLHEMYYLIKSRILNTFQSWGKQKGSVRIGMDMLLP